MHKYTEKLFKLKESDEKFRNFSKKIICDTNSEIIGVKIPKIKTYAKSLPFNENEFLAFFNKKHLYFEEKLLHGILLSKFNDLNTAYRLLYDYLPQIDSWAITDSVIPLLKNLNKDKPIFLAHIKKWLMSDKPYTVRFAIVSLLDYFLTEEYVYETINLVKHVQSQHYYVNMAIAWLYSVILVKNYQSIIPLIESKTLTKFIQNKTISKATDSLRISKDKKEYLKTLKI